MKSIAYGMSLLLIASNTIAAPDWSQNASLPGTAQCEMHNEHSETNG